jgi:hypothetical protein
MFNFLRKKQFSKSVIEPSANIPVDQFEHEEEKI